MAADTPGQDDPALILASTSPRRLELLRSVGIDPIVRPPAVDESPRVAEDPSAYVLRVARDKARGSVRTGTHIVLAADTAVVLGTRILGKPDDAADAMQMLRDLSGRSHAVLTGVVVVDAAGREHSTVVSTAVRMRPLSADEIRAYVATGEPLDKAGAYAIQGGAAAFVEGIEGSWSNVVGLPLDETLALLREAGSGDGMATEGKRLQAARPTKMEGIGSWPP